MKFENRGGRGGRGGSFGGRGRGGFQSRGGFNQGRSDFQNRAPFQNQFGAPQQSGNAFQQFSNQKFDDSSSRGTGFERSGGNFRGGRGGFERSGGRGGRGSFERGGRGGFDRGFDRSGSDRGGRGGFERRYERKSFEPYNQEDRYNGSSSGRGGRGGFDRSGGNFRGGRGGGFERGRGGFERGGRGGSRGGFARGGGNFRNNDNSSFYNSSNQQQQQQKQSIEDPFKLIQDAVRSRDVVNFNLLITQFGKQRQLANITKVFAALVKSKVRPTVITFSSLINACIRCGNLAKAKFFHKQMRKYRIKPNEITYTTLIKGFCQEGQVKQAMQLYNQMKSKSVKPNIRTFNTMLRGCLRNGETEIARQVFEDVKKTLVDQPEQQQQQQQHGKQEEEALSSTAYGYFVKCLCQALLVEEANKIAQEMKQAKLHYSPAFSALAVSCALLGDINGAKRAIEEAKNMAQEEKNSIPHGDARVSVPLFLKLRSEEVLRDISIVEEYLAMLGAKKPMPNKFGVFPNSTRVKFITGEKEQEKRAEVVQEEEEDSDEDGNNDEEEEPSNNAEVVQEQAKEEDSKMNEATADDNSDDEDDDDDDDDDDEEESSNLNFSKIFGNNNPVKVELCSGHGDWIVEKARKDFESNWIAVEMRFERVFMIWSKLVFNQADNLLILGGNVNDIVTIKSFALNSVDEIFINYPEPPSSVEAKNLFGPFFLRNVFRILKPSGSITYVTDNDQICKLVTSEFELKENVKLFKNSFEKQKYQTKIPADYGTSYFDRFWNNANKTRRFYIKYLKQDVDLDELANKEQEAFLEEDVQISEAGEGVEANQQVLDTPVVAAAAATAKTIGDADDDEDDEEGDEEGDEQADEEGDDDNSDAAEQGADEEAGGDEDQVLQ